MWGRSAIFSGILYRGVSSYPALFVAFKASSYTNCLAIQVESIHFLFLLIQMTFAETVILHIYAHSLERL